MDWIRDLALGLLGLGFVGDLCSRHLFKSDRQANRAKADTAAAEANTKEWELEEARITQLHDTVKTLNDLLKTQAERIAEQNAALDEKTDRIRQLTDRSDRAEQLANRLNARIVEITEECGNLKVLVEHYRMWHCRKGDCSDRLPPNPALAGIKYKKPINTTKSTK